MKRLLSLLFVCFSLGVSAQQTITVSVKNPSKTERHDQPVVIPLVKYGGVASALVTVDGQEIACQLDDLDQDEQFDELCFLADLRGKETKRYTVKLFADGEPRTYPARVYAEMVMGNKSVKEKNKQNNYIEAITARGDCAYSYNLQHHHGVDFESELNGIRIYFDQRQTLDLYGKFKKRLELQATQFYTSDEQKAEGYGDDVLWVGNTFGLGAFRGWDGEQPTMVAPVKSRTQRIISYGPLRTIVEVVDRGWQAPVDSSQFTVHSSQSTANNSQFTVHSSQSTANSSQFTVHSSQSTANSSQFTVHSSQSTANSSQFTVHSSQSSNNAQPNCELSTVNCALNMTLRYTQYAGHRDTDVDVMFNRDASAYLFSTGVINVKGSTEFSDRKGLRGCWGTDYPAADTVKWKRETVGLAVLIPQQNIVSEQPANKDNYAFVVRPQGKAMAYKVVYCSANEEFGFHSADEWFAWLRQWRKEADQPVEVSIGKATKN